MELQNTVVPATNRFASLYIENMEKIKEYFHYDITENGIFRQRYRDVMKRDFNRTRLAACMEKYMSRFPKSDATGLALEKLRDPQSVVVIGGQQAGLLTGPLYTIHKIISIIKLAEQQEKELGIPVVPVFWVAGEDHDYQEINHLYIKEHRTLKKMTYPQQMGSKKMASHIEFDKEVMKRWIRQLFSMMGERPHTNEMLLLLDEAAHQADTLVDFFSYIVLSLFKDYGLLLIDSADPSLRELEKPYFARLIELNQDIASAVLSRQAVLDQRGFHRAIDMDENAANLFLNTDKGRELLLFDSAKKVFISKGGDVMMTEEQLLQLLEQHPESFSNNVVTRPLMQEWLFPTLAFIAGPGEIAYWGELKTAFETAGMTMPPVVPRLNVTLLDRSIERELEELDLSLEKVLQCGCEAEKEQFLKNIQDRQLDALVQQTKESLQKHYQKIRAHIGQVDRGHTRLADTNLAFHLQQLDFLKRKVEESIMKQHEAVLNKYLHVEQMLRPDGRPQERFWNIFYFLNDYGPHFIHSLINISYEFDGKHKVLRI
ncbi:bacillithiol biosynthesis cysteine-adding enzyme BshC [Siminovitchia sp. 179-K 8D1 HS]|uniref:bacillithiol biosynthesis cysteine-adding enzyme BshC n=1 Tax=Siminovitchia sp. 179-K 8D1 HS TaxID=3142385 RepID=UPI0039A34B03